MKILITLSGLILLATFACKKDDKPLLAYDQLTRTEIVNNEAKFSTNQIVGSGINGDVLKPGAIILFRTNIGNYGKMQIISIASADNEFTLSYNMTVYKSDGTELIPQTKFDLSITHACNLDTASDISDNTSDFEWKSDDINLFIEPLNGAEFYLYSN